MGFAANAQNTTHLFDPTKPELSATTQTNAKGKAQQPWALESIIQKNKRYKAVISSNLYQQGDKLGHYRITKISANTVFLANDTQQLKLELYRDEIKH